MHPAPLIKICGIKTAPLLDHVIAQGADMVGFMNFAKSPRHIDLATISALTAQAGGRIETAIVLVDPDDALVDAAAATGIDWMQLHGAETPDRVATIRIKTGCRVLKALPIGGPEDLSPISEYAAVADLVLLDAKPPKDASRPGGLGERFDWGLLENLDPSLRFMLSGGLNADNVAQAVREIRPYGLDVSSGVERERGEKDADLISRFIANARAEV